MIFSGSYLAFMIFIREKVRKSSSPYCYMPCIYLFQIPAMTSSSEISLVCPVTVDLAALQQ